MNTTQKFIDPRHQLPEENKELVFQLHPSGQVLPGIFEKEHKNNGCLGRFKATSQDGDSVTTSYGFLVWEKNQYEVSGYKYSNPSEL